MIGSWPYMQTYALQARGTDLLSVETISPANAPCPASNSSKQPARHTLQLYGIILRIELVWRAV